MIATDEAKAETRKRIASPLGRMVSGTRPCTNLSRSQVWTAGLSVSQTEAAHNFKISWKKEK
jgi:hypothetical protein